MSLDEAKKELADEPFKLELVDIKGDVDAAEVDAPAGDGLSVSRIIARGLTASAVGPGAARTVRGGPGNRW